MDCCGSGSSNPKPKNNLSTPKAAGSGAGLTKSSLILDLVLVLIAGMVFGYVIKPSGPSEDHLAMIKNKSIADQRADWMALADNIRGKLAMEGKYDCCLEKPCWYCIQKTPEHGEAAECTCRQDILDGRHPCGECIGEILEGHGEKDLVPFFAKAIAHKVGSQHEVHLQEIIDDMYR
jgi:hypothetical protein